MLQRKIINDELCAVSFEPTEIQVRKRGVKFYGTEEQLLSIRDGILHIDLDVAEKYNIPIQIYTSNEEEYEWARLTMVQ